MVNGLFMHVLTIHSTNQISFHYHTLLTCVDWRRMEPPTFRSVYIYPSHSLLTQFLSVHIPVKLAWNEAVAMWLTSDLHVDAFRPYTPMRGALSTVWFDRLKISRDCPEHLESIDAMCSTLGSIIEGEVKAGIPKDRVVIGMELVLTSCVVWVFGYRLDFFSDTDANLIL